RPTRPRTDNGRPPFFRFHAAMSKETEALLQLLEAQEEQILAEWLAEGGADAARITDAGRRTMRAEAGELLRALREALKAGGDADNFQGPAWGTLRQSLEGLSR